MLFLKDTNDEQGLCHFTRYLSEIQTCLYISLEAKQVLFMYFKSLKRKLFLLVKLRSKILYFFPVPSTQIYRLLSEFDSKSGKTRWLLFIHFGIKPLIWHIPLPARLVGTTVRANKSCDQLLINTVVKDQIFSLGLHHADHHVSG